MPEPSTLTTMIEVKLPSLGDGIDTGDVLELLVKEGDIVAKDQGIIELETGKATLQVPSSAAGKVVKVHVAPGQTIPDGAPLLTLEGQESGVRGQQPAAAKNKPEPKARGQEAGARSQEPVAKPQA